MFYKNGGKNTFSLQQKMGKRLILLALAARLHAAAAFVCMASVTVRLPLAHAACAMHSHASCPLSRGGGGCEVRRRGARWSRMGVRWSCWPDASN